MLLLGFCVAGFRGVNGDVFLWLGLGPGLAWLGLAWLGCVSARRPLGLLFAGCVPALDWPLHARAGQDLLIV